jgi:hypothetical protein
LEVHVFIWDLYQSSRINQLDMKVDRLMDAEAKVEGARRVEVDLDEKVNRLALICRAMFELLQQSTGLSEEQLTKKILEIDLRDGQADGRMTPKGKVCPKCGATMSPKFGRCLFCGYKDESAASFV